MEGPSAYAEQRYKDGLECARRATQFDQSGQFSAALSFYSETVESLTEACHLAPIFSPILPRVHEYARRAEEIRQYLASNISRGAPTGTAPPSAISKDEKVLRHVEYLLELAHRDAEHGQRAEAQKLYSCAIDLALQAQGQMSRESEKQRIKMITMEALDKLEQLKLAPAEAPPTAPPLERLLDQMPSPPTTQPVLGKKTPPPPRRGPLMSFLDADSDLSTAPKFTAYSGGKEGGRTSPRPHPLGDRPPPATTTTVGGKQHKGARFTEQELKVLKATSRINGVVYLPWSDADLVELRRITPLPQEFEDPGGALRLADKQRAQISGWMRPYDICENPHMIHLVSSFSIKQTLIGDCSFVASLAISADYERKFKTKLITRLIHPQNRHGEPIMNPNGKYLISLNLNGCRRKVVIDDRLPVGQHGELLCSYSSNSDEFWVSLIEKAYMKVMGGYDFPGSSSNIDLHALTGWIPERIGVKSADDTTFKMMEKSLKKGNALITVATGQLTDDLSERTGLVPTHAYAVLNVVDIKGLKLLQLKNPWSHKRWKGNYSEHDKVNWNTELRKTLNFDQTQALQIDNGVFWVDWKSVKAFYDVLYINWRPNIFAHKSTIHDVWQPSGVEKDWYDLSNNPQYSLRVQCSDQAARVWVLLSRHITTKSDFANNEKFITMSIARSDGKRVFFPDKFLVQGVKINTPHYLAKLDGVPHGASTYTVIVSQLESLSTIYYTLRVYSTCDFALNPVPNPYIHHKQLKGEWKTGQRGPLKFRLTTSSHNTEVMVKLQAPKQVVVRLELIAESDKDFQKVDSGPLRPGFTILQTHGLPKGSFSVVPSYFNELPARGVPFFVTLYCDSVFNFEL